MRILFVWTGLTSYMGDCWRELAGRRDVDLKVLVAVEGRNAQQIDFRQDDVLRGLDAIVVDDDAQPPEFEGWRPDVMFVVGWRSKLCRSYVKSSKWSGVPKVCCFDMPWRWKLRCLVAPWALRSFLRNYSAAFVPGMVCERYARWLGFRKIHKGLFGISTGKFAGAEGCAGNSGDFLYIGRNSTEKRLDVLQEGHRIYRERGGGRDIRLFGKGLPGGFISPSNVPALFKSSAAFVLASDFDPWPLVLLEAMSAECPVIASDRCTNRPELGKNWLVFRHGDAGDLAKALARFDSMNDSDIKVMKQENLELANQYDCSKWADRVFGIVEDLGASL